MVFSAYYIHTETFIILVHSSETSSFAACDWTNDLFHVWKASFATSHWLELILRHDFFVSMSQYVDNKLLYDVPVSGWGCRGAPQHSTPWVPGRSWDGAQVAWFAGTPGSDPKKSCSTVLGNGTKGKRSEKPLVMCTFDHSRLQPSIADNRRSRPNQANHSRPQPNAEHCRSWYGWLWIRVGWDWVGSVEVGCVRLRSAKVSYVRLRSTDVGCVHLRSATFCWSRLCSAVFGCVRLRSAMFG